ncbi:MAG TPA: FHA domain-containing protein [Enhygromyxa sp.]|nr:FHA domain-containing protein [Enhygromyxa sp.]
MAVRLIIEDLEGATTVVNLGNEDVTIGRKPHNTIQLTEQNVSRSHAKLIFQDDGWLIQDLGSYNGVRVNGVPINGPTLLRESDLIQIGDYHLTLTDDVDRETVDIERPRAAANDHMAMGAGASSELPSVSVDDLPPMRPPNMAPGDSAAYRTDSVSARPEDEKKNKSGLIFAVLGILGVLLAIAVVVMFVGDKDEKPDREVAGKSDQPAKSDDSGVPADTGEVAPDDGAALAEAGELVETDGGSPTDDGGELIEPDDGDSPTDDGGELVETDGGSEPEDTPSKPKPSKPKNGSKPPEPKLPPDQALAEARKASLTGNNRKAYSLAKDAYDQNKSSEALSVMGVAACKMGSESKAKAVYKKMSDKDKQTLEKICSPLGIELQ